MLYRKIENKINKYLLDNASNKILIVNGARQVGKSFIIRYIGKTVLSNKYKNYIEINFIEDYLGDKLFENVRTINDFYFQLSIFAGERMGNKDDTLVFIDEIQQYPQFLTLLKFLKQDDRFTYICSGSLLGVTLYKTPSLPIGSVEIVQMYPLDFEEFLLANGFNKEAVNIIRKKFIDCETLDLNTHNKIMDLFKKYLIVGGMPDAVNSYLNTVNIYNIRNIQNNIFDFYGDDASKYDKEHKLKIKRIYDLIPSNLENKKKRLIIKNIENINGKRTSDYIEEFDYLVNSGVALAVKAISSPTFPLIQSSSKNLLKLYLNDVGLLTNILYKYNANAILKNENSINLGSVYENVVASELKAHDHNLFYYDNKKNGEVDFLIDDYNTLSIIPIEVKSGKDYTIHNAITKMTKNKEYNIKNGYILSNERKITKDDKLIYMPIYMVMFL